MSSHLHAQSLRFYQPGGIFLTGQLNAECACTHWKPVPTAGGQAAVAQTTPQNCGFPECKHGLPHKLCVYRLLKCPLKCSPQPSNTPEAAECCTCAPSRADRLVPTGRQLTPQATARSAGGRGVTRSVRGQCHTEGICRRFMFNSHHGKKSTHRLQRSCARINFF